MYVLSCRCLCESVSESINVSRFDFYSCEDRYKIHGSLLCKERGSQTEKLALLLIKNMKYCIVQFLSYKNLQESPNCACVLTIHCWLSICINNRYIHLFIFLFSWKLTFLHTYHRQYTCTSPLNKKNWYTENHVKTH